MLCCNVLTWPHVLRLTFLKEFQASKKAMKSDFETTWVQKFIVDCKTLKDLSLTE